MRRSPHNDQWRTLGRDHRMNFENVQADVPAGTFSSEEVRDNPLRMSARQRGDFRPGRDDEEVPEPSVSEFDEVAIGRRHDAHVG